MKLLKVHEIYIMIRKNRTIWVNLCICFLEFFCTFAKKMVKVYHFIASGKKVLAFYKMKID